MDFFLEIHNGECGLGEHFCDQVRCHGPSECLNAVLRCQLGTSRNCFDTEPRTQNSKARIYTRRGN